MDDGIIWLLIVIGIGVLCMMPTFYKLSREDSAKGRMLDMFKRMGFICEDPGHEVLYLEGAYRDYVVKIGASKEELVRERQRDAEPVEEGAINTFFNAIPASGRTGASLAPTTRLTLRVQLKRDLPSALWIRSGGRFHRPGRPGLEQVSLGIQSFDAKLSVYAVDVAATQRLFEDPSVREWFAKLLLSYRPITLMDGMLYSYSSMEPKEMLAALDTLIDDARALDDKAAPTPSDLLAAFERPVGSS
jgi:hypothetical protein